MRMLTGFTWFMVEITPWVASDIYLSFTKGGKFLNSWATSNLSNRILPHADSSCNFVLEVVFGDL